MKLLHHSQEVTVADGVSVAVKARVVTVKGPRGELVKNFKHLKVEMKSTGPRSILVEKWMCSSKDKAAVRTVCSHISNMSKGVTLGFRYKLRAAYAHFPINCTVVQGGALLEVRNFWARSFCERFPWPRESRSKFLRRKRTSCTSTATISNSCPNPRREFSNRRR